MSRTEIPMTMTAPEHPSLGTASGAVVSPVTASIFRVTRGDRILGFVEAVGTDWVGFAGPALERSEEIGRYATLSAALQDLGGQSERPALRLVS